MIRKLTDNDLTNLAGTTLKGYHVEGVRIKSVSCTDSDHYGIILARDDSGNYVTWQFHYEDDEISVYWGHYFADDRESAKRDFDIRDLDAKPFKVTITEILKHTVEVEAKDKQEAEQIISDNWKNGGYVLGADNFVNATFNAVPADNTIPSEAGRCPACGHDAIDYGDSGIEDMNYYYRWTCGKCDSSGKEYHDLVFNEHILDD